LEHPEAKLEKRKDTQMRLLIFFSLFLASNPVFAGGGTYFSQSINTILLVALLVAVARKPILHTFKNRSKMIEYDIEQAQETLKKASLEDKSIQDQLDNLAARIAELKSDAEQEALNIKKDLAEQAVKERLRIKKSTEVNIQERLEVAKDELKRETVSAAILLAEKQLKTQIQSSDQSRLSQEFIVGLSSNSSQHISQ
jgi:F-type H+-transporting ATPase subunit b